MTALIATILYLQINLYRLQEGALFVQESPVACQFAEMRLERTSKDFSHTGLKEDFETLNLPKETVGYENLGRKDGNNFVENSNRIFQLWKESTTHNKNLLRDLDEMCLRTDGNYYVFSGIKYGK